MMRPGRFSTIASTIVIYVLLAACFLASCGPIEQLTADPTLQSLPTTEIIFSPTLQSLPTLEIISNSASLPPVKISISNTIVANDIEPIGVNLNFLSGGTNLLTNNLIWGSGMEPAIARYLVRVEQTGSGWMEWEQSLGGIHMFDQNAAGFGDGATVRLYRIVDASGQPLSYGGGTALEDVSGADHVIFLGETQVPAGGWVADGSEDGANRVYLSDETLRLAYGDHAIITVEKKLLPKSQVNTRLHEWFVENVNILSVQPEEMSAALVPHPASLPNDFSEPGETCLQLTILSPAGGRAGQYLFHGHDEGEGQWYSQLTPGATYRAEVWLRQEGLANASVRFYAGGPYESLTQSAAWQVTDQWQKFTYDFVAPAYPSAAQGHADVGIQVIEGPGRLWLDNFIVYRYDAEHQFSPFTPNQTTFQSVMNALPASGIKPALRFYTTTYVGHSDMAHLLSNYANSRLDFIYNIQPANGQTVTVPQALNLTLATGDNPQNRAVPYITLSEEYTEIEWLQLVEYLGVPYDPAVDTPQIKPWAYLRSQQRGSGTPWTDEFREIVLEFGNETWHAGVGGFGWDGFGRPGWIHSGGREYGLFAEHYFVQNVAAQPWWSEYHLGSKIKFALNANYEASLNEWGDSYGELAAQQAPTVTAYLGHANYVGPKWETGEEPFQTFDDHGMQETLVGAYLTMFPLIENIAAVRNQLAAENRANYRPIAYEGGPSGYYVPGQGTDEQVAISELYGKSLGMGVSALDAWLYSSLNGYAHQGYFAMGGGDAWSSHTMPEAGSFRPHSAWLALEMRNRYAPGDVMLQTSLEGVPTYAREGEEIPLISAYAIQSEDTLSVFVLSRKLDGEHDGMDFGDGTTPVTLNLPFNECRALTRYALTAPDGSPADPRVNNIESQNIVISEVALNPAECADGILPINESTGGVIGGMPPGTIYLYVFETGTSLGSNSKFNFGSLVKGLLHRRARPER